MITFEEAKRIAEEHISSRPVLNAVGVFLEMMIIDKAIIEKPYAWIFPYTSRKYFETKDMKHAIAGNGPLFVSKIDGQISSFRTGLSIEEMIGEYEELNKLWQLHLLEDVYGDSKRVHDLKIALHLPMEEVASYKDSKRMVLAEGSHTRLSGLLEALEWKKIATKIILRNLE